MHKVGWFGRVTWMERQRSRKGVSREKRGRWKRGKARVRTGGERKKGLSESRIYWRGIMWKWRRSRWGTEWKVTLRYFQKCLSDIFLWCRKRSSSDLHELSTIAAGEEVSILSSVLMLVHICSLLLLLLMLEYYFVIAPTTIQFIYFNSSLFITNHNNSSFKGLYIVR